VSHDNDLLTSSGLASRWRTAIVSNDNDLLTS